MKQKITVVTLCAMLFALCLPAEAQQAGKVPCIGFLDSSTASGMVINLKTAKQIGLTIPQSMLYRADKVIK